MKLDVDARPREGVNLESYYRSTRMDVQTIPTGDHRHISHVREGRQSAEVWSRKRRAEIHEEFDGPIVPWYKVKEKITDASKSVSKRGTESVSSDEKAVRREKGKKRVLRAGKQAGQGEVNEREGEERVQKAKAIKRAAQKKVGK